MNSTPVISYRRVQTQDGPRFVRESGTEGLLLRDAPWHSTEETGESLSLAAHAPIRPVVPTKIVCVGLNYALHVKESASESEPPEEPVLFLKPPSALIGPGEAILLPPEVGRVDHEAELALVIGRRLRNAEPEEAMRAVFAVTALNDVTARALQMKDGQWTRAKGFDTFCPTGPRLVRGVDPDDLHVEARVNGETRQAGRTRDLLFSCGTLVAFASRVMTLLPGDLVSTGTPSGVGPIQSGDVVEIEVEGVGVLRNPVSLAR